jgi:hypothetical protein
MYSEFLPRTPCTFCMPFIHCVWNANWSCYMMQLYSVLGGAQKSKQKFPVTIVALRSTTSKIEKNSSKHFSQFVWRTLCISVPTWKKAGQLSDAPTCCWSHWKLHVTRYGNFKFPYASNITTLWKPAYDFLQFTTEMHCSPEELVFSQREGNIRGTSLPAYGGSLGSQFCASELQGCICRICEHQREHRRH